MRVVLILLVSLTFCAACSKHKSVTPANNPPDSISKTSTTDTGRTVQATYLAHTDTFYGGVYVTQDYYTFPGGIAGYSFVYAQYTSTGLVSFSSTYNSDDQYQFNGPFVGTFAVSSSNRYYYDTAGFAYKTRNITYTFTLRNDSLLFTGTRWHCPDTYITNFLGKNIN